MPSLHKTRWRRNWASLMLLPAMAVMAADPGAAPSTTVIAPGLHLTGHAGPLVVLQSGLGDDHASWSRLVPDLARDHRVVAVDRPGYAGLPRPDAPADPCTLAEQTRQRLNAAGLAPPYLLVGHSLGGRYAAAQALLHPQEAAGLVLVDATPPGHWTRMQAETPGLAMLMKTLRATAFDATRRQEFDDQDVCWDRLAPAAAAASAPASAPTSAASAATPVTPAASVPTIVLAAARRRPEETDDYVALLARGQALWLPLTGAARVEVAHDAGHYIQRDAPDRVAAAVRRLSGVMPGAAAAAPASADLSSVSTAAAAADDTLPDTLRDGLRQLRAGTSTREQTLQALGEPTERQTHADAEVWVYNPRKKLPPLLGWLPVVGDVLEVAELAQQRMRRHELILEFDTAGVLRRRTVRALDG